MQGLHTQYEQLILRTVAKLTGLIVCVTLVLLLLAIFQSSAFAAPLVQVRPEVKVAEDVVTLGDVFVGLEKNADYVLTSAPKSGETINWNAATLQKIAVHFGLSYTPNSSDAVNISRVSSDIAYQTIVDVVVDSLRAEGLDGRFDIQLNALSNEDWQVPGSDVQVKVDRLSIDRENSKFRVTLRAGKETLVSDGLIIPLIAVPTLRRSLAPGDKIRAEDIVYNDMKMKDVRKDVLLQADQLVGLTPRKPLALGTTIRAADVTAPRLIKRGDLVPLIFKNDRITLNTRAKAEEDGFLGSSIRVLNATSNRPLEGVVGANGEVIVTN